MPSDPAFLRKTAHNTAPGSRSASLEMAQHALQAHWFPFLLIFYEIGTYLANDMYLPALPEIAQTFGMDQALAQSTLSLFFLGSGSLQLILGPLSDRIGRRPVLLGGTLVFISATALCTFTQSIPLFLAGRFLQGTVVCSMIIGGYTTVHSLYQGKKVVQLLSMMASVVVLAPALGPVVGALLLMIMPWRGLFALLLVWGVLSAVALYYGTPETLSKPESIHPGRLLSSYYRVFTHRAFLRFCLTFALLLGTLFIWIVESPFVIMEVHGHSQLFFGISQLFVFGGFTAGTFMAKHTLERHPVKNVIQRGLQAVALGIGSFCILALWGAPTQAQVAAMTLSTLGIGSTCGPLQRLAIEASKEPLGRRMGVFSTLIGALGGAATWGMTWITHKSFLHLGWALAAIATVAIGVFYSSKAPVEVQEDSGVH